MMRRGAAVGTVLLLILLLLGGIPLRSVWAQSVPSSQTWELLRPASDTASSPSSGAKGAIRQRAVRVDAAAFGEEGVQRGDTLALNFFAKAAFRGRVRAVERPTAATTVLRGTLDGRPVSTFSVAHTAGRVHVVAMTAEGNTYDATTRPVPPTWPPSTIGPVLRRRAAAASRRMLWAARWRTM